MNTPSQAAMQQVIAALEVSGYVPAGATHQEHVRIPTSAAPVFGGIGGELATFGGRLRYTLPGTDRRATVGLRWTYLYRVEAHAVTEGQGYRTLRDVAEIVATLTSGK